MTTIGIIPARYASTRFPGKPLVDIGGKPMIQRVYEQARRSRLDAVYVATDDRRIAAIVEGFGGRVVHTSEQPNGTARCIAAFRQLQSQAQHLVNIQGDEPFVQPEQIDTVLQVLEHSEAPIATLAKVIEHPEVYHATDVVKIATAPTNQAAIYRALYFSRAPIPAIRETDRLMEVLQQGRLLRHIGLYGFKKAFIEQYTPKVSPLSDLEQLEQLTWLEQGYTIHLGLTQWDTPAIDTPADLERALAWLQAHPDH